MSVCNDTKQKRESQKTVYECVHPSTASSSHTTPPCPTTHLCTPAFDSGEQSSFNSSMEASEEMLLTRSSRGSNRLTESQPSRPRNSALFSSTESPAKWTRSRSTVEGALTVSSRRQPRVRGALWAVRVCSTLACTRSLLCCSHQWRNKSQELLEVWWREKEGQCVLLVYETHMSTTLLPTIMTGNSETDVN